MNGTYARVGVQGMCPLNLCIYQNEIAISSSSSSSRQLSAVHRRAVARKSAYFAAPALCNNATTSR